MVGFFTRGDVFFCSFFFAFFTKEDGNFLFAFSTRGDGSFCLLFPPREMVSFLCFFFLFFFSNRGDNFCDFLFAFLHIESLLKGVYSKRKEFTPKSLY